MMQGQPGGRLQGLLLLPQAEYTPLHKMPNNFFAVAAKPAAQWPSSAQGCFFIFIFVVAVGLLWSSRKQVFSNL